MAKGINKSPAEPYRVAVLVKRAEPACPDKGYYPEVISESPKDLTVERSLYYLLRMEDPLPGVGDLVVLELTDEGPAAWGSVNNLRERGERLWTIVNNKEDHP